MLGLKHAALWAALCACASRAAVDYCGAGAGLCAAADAHTFCRYPEGPGPACSGYMDERLSGAEKARLVARLNQRRSEAARGALGLPPASDMLTLRWVEELAREAQIWADQCAPPSYPEQHDECRDLYAVTVGQCVASVVGEAPGLRPESMADMWFLQGRQRGGALSLYPMNSENAPVDFAQMLWSRTYLVGCARSRFMLESAGRLRAVTRLVCNFAPRLSAGAGAALWAPGAPAAACPPPARADPRLPALCAFHPNETFSYDVTNSTVLKEQLALETVLEIERNDSLNYRSCLDQIYLTKMMVASMINQTTEITSTDIVTVEYMATENTNVFTNATENNQKNIDDAISKMISNASTTPISKKALHMIGRPKSYNMDELNAVHKDLEYGSTRPVGAVKEDDSYRDYELEDITESNETNKLEYTASGTENIITTAFALSVTQLDKIENATETMIENESSYITTTETVHSSNSEISKATPSNVENETATLFVQNDILKRLLELSQKTEENPSDPETARQLDEALKHMEKVLATPVASSKVRRELRPRPEEARTEQPSLPPQPSPKREVPPELTQGQKIKEIGTPDAAPILAIINKYAPLIKSYGGLFTRSDASNATRSLFLLLGCIVSTTF